MNTTKYNINNIKSKIFTWQIHYFIEILLNFVNICCRSAKIGETSVNTLIFETLV